MSNSRSDDRFRRIFLPAPDSSVEQKAPSRVKAHIYSALIREQQASGPLESLSGTQAAGHGLCVFEKLVQIAPIGEAAKTPFFCRSCHARVLAEKFEGVPIYWRNCPYAGFKKG